MNNIVFLVVTEYQLIVSLGIIRQYFSQGYNIIVIRMSPIERPRLNNLDFEGTGLGYHEIIYDYKNPTSKLKDQLQFIIDLKPEKFFFFLEGKFWMNYLFSKLHKLGTKIILGPDGMKTYNDHGILPINQRTRNLIYGMFYSAKTRLLPTWPHVEKTYATSRFIDEVWVEHPNFYNNKTHKKVIEFHITMDDSFVKLLFHVFCVNEKDMDIIHQAPSILFFDSSYHTDDYYKKTIEILEAIQSKHPEMKVMVKHHPLSKKYSHDVFSKMQKVYELNSDYPAELYIASAKESLVVSMVSTCELFFNPHCDYYWIYKLYPDFYKNKYGKLSNPTEYIHVVESIDEIK